MKRLKKVLPAVLAVLLFMPAQNALFALPPENKTADCYKLKVEKWIGRHLSKQKNRKTLKEINSNKYRFTPPAEVVTPAQEIPLKMLGTLPSLRQWYELSGGINYTRFNVLKAGQNYFVIADTHKKCETTGIQDFYLCKGDDYVRLLRVEHVSEKITAVKLDNSGTEFIKTEDNSCGTIWRGALYNLDKDEKLVKVLDLGGFRAGVYYVRLKDNEALTVVNAFSEYIEDAKLRKTLEKCPGFTADYFTKPQLSHVNMFKWNGSTFSKFGEAYYHRPEYN